MKHIIAFSCLLQRHYKHLLNSKGKYEQGMCQYLQWLPIYIALVYKELLMFVGYHTTESDVGSVRIMFIML